MTPVLLNSAGRPEPSPEIQRRLSAISPGLKMQWIEGIGSTWAITMAYREGDRRWEWIQNGTMSPDRAFDILGYIPRDCSIEQAPAYVERMFRTYPRADVNRMVEAVQKWNDTQVAESSVDEAIGSILDSSDPSAVQAKKRGRPRKG